MRAWGRGRARLTRVAAAIGAVSLMLGTIAAVGSVPARAAATAPVRVAMPGSATYPGSSVYTGSWSLGIRHTVHPKVSLGRGVRFVRGKLVVAKRSGTRWVAAASTTSTRRSGLQVALAGGIYRITLTVRTLAPGRSRSTSLRKVSYLTIWPGPKPAPPIIVIPPAPTAPTLVLGSSWHGQQFDDTQDPGRLQMDTWFAVRISNSSASTGLARSRRQIYFPVSGVISSIFDDVPTLPAAGKGWFVTTCAFNCQAFPISGDIVIKPFTVVPSSIVDAERPTTSASSIAVVPGAVFDMATVTTSVSNPSARELAAGTPAHVVLLNAAGIPVYAFRSTTPSAVAARSTRVVSLAPTGTTGVRWSDQLPASVASIQITLDPAA